MILQDKVALVTVHRELVKPPRLRSVLRVQKLCSPADAMQNAKQLLR
ncbi:hypothetical protein [Nostoc sp. DedQUE09]